MAGGARAAPAWSPGGAFGACGEGWLRLSFATAERAELEAALGAMERYFEDGAGSLATSRQS